MSGEEGFSEQMFTAPEAPNAPPVDYAHLPALNHVWEIERAKEGTEFTTRQLQANLETLLAQPLFQEILRSTELMDQEQIDQLFTRDLELFKRDDEHGHPLPYPKSIEELYRNSSLADVSTSANLPTITNYLAQKLNGYFPILSAIEMKRELLKEKSDDPAAVTRITKSIQGLEEALVPEATKIARLLLELKRLSDRQYSERESEVAVAK